MQFTGVDTSSIQLGLMNSPLSVETFAGSPYALVVDDDEAIISVLMFFLETEGYYGIGLHDSLKVPSFLASLEDKQLPSVILLDLMMPGLSGYELAAYLARSERYKHIPVIIMSADSRIRGPEAVEGAIDWVPKPFQLASLLSKLQPYLEQSAL